MIRPSNPIVSIIVPTYNRAHLISRAIWSAQAQTFQDWEMLVVDDASSDNTEEVIRDIQDSRIVYLRHEVNKGAGEARNTGIKTAQGSYIAFLDSDDEWLPGKLEFQLERFEKSPYPRLGAVLCGERFVAEDPRLKSWDYIPRVNGWAFDALLWPQTLLNTAMILAKRECFADGLLFDTALPAGEERDLMLRIARDWQVDTVPQLLLNIHLHSGPRISDFSRRSELKGRLMLLEKYSNEYAARPHFWALAYRRVASCYNQMGDLQGTRNALLTALRINPLDVKTAITLAASLGGLRGINALSQGLEVVASTLSPHYRGPRLLGNRLRKL